RQEGASLLGVPVAGSISIDDSEAVLRAIRLTPPEQPIDIILHTPGGLVLAAEQIAKALVERKGKVTVFVPHYAMSGGNLIAAGASARAQGLERDAAHRVRRDGSLPAGRRHQALGLVRAAAPGSGARRLDYAAVTGHPSRRKGRQRGALRPPRRPHCAARKVM